MLEVRIPIGLSNSMRWRCVLIAHSIREFYPDAKIRVTIGASDYRNFDSFVELFRRHNIDWVLVGPDAFNAWRGTNNTHMATMSERYESPTTADCVIMLDADVLCMRAFQESIPTDRPYIGAVMAHASPFSRHEFSWKDIYEAAHLPPPDFTLEHSGWGIMEFDPVRRYSPPYFNTGVVFMSKQAHDAIRTSYPSMLEIVRSKFDSYFADQIAFTLAIEACKLTPHTEILSLRYNFPNQGDFDTARPAELANVHFIHFLRSGLISRENDFDGLAAMARFAKRRDLVGSNEALRQRVDRLLQHIIAVHNA